MHNESKHGTDYKYKYYIHLSVIYNGSWLYNWVWD